ncbi:integrase core domain protein [Lasius niger]|uniref:Integrase core domain protein n=1 Tax=Lasius niger TaxID=67767 RepID=A0A0J7N702_LASNI|nr:integrase core domain protein [Lasius niger]
MIDPFNKFSDFKKLIRVAAMCIRFARICTKKNEVKALGPLSPEVEYARKCIIRKEQRTAFCEELKALRRGIEISHKSSVRAMNPFLDEDDILRVGGRLKHSEFHPDAKHPILLPHHSRLAELIIQYEHKKNLHARVEATLAAV